MSTHVGGCGWMWGCIPTSWSSCSRYSPNTVSRGSLYNSQYVLPTNTHANAHAHTQTRFTTWIQQLQIYSSYRFIAATDWDLTAWCMSRDTRVQSHTPSPMALRLMLSSRARLYRSVYSECGGGSKHSARNCTIELLIIIRTIRRLQNRKYAGGILAVWSSVYYFERT